LDHVSEALKKAHASLEGQHRPSIERGPVPISSTATARPEEPTVAPRWTAPEVTLNPKHLERHRVVSYEMADPSHVAFNMLRTRVRTAMKENNWRTIGVTSPNANCGKTLISVNLALSLARGTDDRVVLLDLDLKRPTVARILGVNGSGTVSRFLLGKAKADECFVQVAPSLTVGLNGGHLMESSELLQGPRFSELLSFVNSALAPDVIVFDLPPMGGSDDALALLPRLDTALLIAAAGHTTAAQIDECEQQLAEREKFLGLVLNKTETSGRPYYY
jgi:protein-tyrosine kinase